MDDPFVTCPYNQTHRVPRSRIQAHLVKCEKNSPPFAICPYNATHRLPTKELLRKHITTCPAKDATFPDEKTSKVTASLTTPTPILQREYLPETDPNHEVWDD